MGKKLESRLHFFIAVFGQEADASVRFEIGAELAEK
jgi:hypothetical protein